MPTSIATTNQSALEAPDAAETSAGPGQKPAMPQPAPKVAAPHGYPVQRGDGAGHLAMSGGAAALAQQLGEEPQLVGDELHIELVRLVDDLELHLIVASQRVR